MPGIFQFPASAERNLQFRSNTNLLRQPFISFKTFKTNPL